MCRVSRVSGGVTRARKVEAAKLFTLQELLQVRVDKLALMNFTQRTQISISDRQNPSSEVKCNMLHRVLTQASLSVQTLHVSHSCRIFWWARSVWQHFRRSIWRQRSIWPLFRRSIWRQAAAKAATSCRTRGVLPISGWYGYVSLRYHPIFQFIDDDPIPACYAARKAFNSPQILEMYRGKENELFRQLFQKSSATAM